MKIASIGIASGLLALLAGCSTARPPEEHALLKQDNNCLFTLGFFPVSTYVTHIDGQRIKPTTRHNWIPIPSGKHELSFYTADYSPHTFSVTNSFINGAKYKVEANLVRNVFDGMRPPNPAAYGGRLPPNAPYEPHYREEYRFEIVLNQ